jgi:putative protease
MPPVSKINALRREGIEAFVNEGHEEKKNYDVNIANALKDTLFCSRLDSERTARFARADQVTDDCRKFFDILYLPLDEYDGSVNGVIVPPVIFEREIESVRRALKKAKALGCEHALVGNLGHIELAREAGLTLHGDFRLNAANYKAVEALIGLGFTDVILSPELNLARVRDIKAPVGCIVYGRIPLMLLEKCVIRELSPCTDYNGDQICHATLTDRRGVKFPVLRESGSHRNTIYNSVPTCMSDRQDELDAYNVTSRHFIFSTESQDEIDRVIDLHLAKKALDTDVRRIIK